MNLLAILFASLLAMTSVLADLPLPDGYWVSKVEPVPKEYQLDIAKENPHVPLLNATIDCSKAHYPFWKEIYILGNHWPGVTEKMVRSIVTGAVTHWKWTSWERQKCFPYQEGEYCTEDAPGFRLSVSLNSATSR